MGKIYTICQMLLRPDKGGGLAKSLVDEVVDSVRAANGEAGRLATLLEEHGGEMGDVQRVLVEAELASVRSRVEILMCRFKDLGGNVKRAAYEDEEE